MLRGFVYGPEVLRPRNDLLILGRELQKEMEEQGEHNSVNSPSSTPSTGVSATSPVTIATSALPSAIIAPTPSTASALTAPSAPSVQLNASQASLLGTLNGVQVHPSHLASSADASICASSADTPHSAASHALDPTTASGAPTVQGHEEVLSDEPTQSDQDTHHSDIFKASNTKLHWSRTKWGKAASRPYDMLCCHLLCHLLCHLSPPSFLICMRCAHS